MTRVHMSPLRLFGDPFASDATGVALRVFLQVCVDSCMDVAICASPAGAFGAKATSSRAEITPSEAATIQAALERTVPSTSPVVVFAASAQTQAALELAALAWPKSCRVMSADRQRPDDLLTRVRAELHWAGTEDPDCGVDEMTLRPWLRMAPPESAHRILHLGSSDPSAGTDVAVRVFAQHFAAEGKTLRVVLPAGDPAFSGFLRQLAAESAPQGVDAVSALEIVTGPLQPAHARDCAVIVQPMRMRHDGDALVCLLASGRPVVATACRDSAAIFGDRSAFVPVGGRLLPIRSGTLEVCEPDPECIMAGLRQMLGDQRLAAAVATRGRAHVIAELLADRPAAPPRVTKVRDARPSVVLEAPFLGDGATAEIAIATAQALHRRGHTNLSLVATAPFGRGLASLHARAPELVSLLTREPGKPDLWLSNNVTLRTQRPECGVFAQRFDCEVEALPSELSPLLVQEQDLVVANRTGAQRLLTAAGRSADVTPVIGLGVDGNDFHEAQAPLADIVAWKGNQPAVLFVGSLTARSGLDVFLRCVMDATTAGQRFCVVIKPCGDHAGDSGYLGGLIERFQSTPGAPPLLVVDRDLSRAELAGLYRACDIYVQPRRGVGATLSLLEARASGIPVITTNQGGSDETEGGHGVVTIDAKRRMTDATKPHLQPPWAWEPDANSLVGCLTMVLSNLPRYAAAARSHAPMVRAQRTWESSAEAIEQVAQVALAKRRGVAPQRSSVAVRDTVAL